MSKASFTITGVVVRIGKLQQITEKFSKQEFVIQFGKEDYPEFVKMEAQKDHTDNLATMQEGETVTCTCDITGHSWVNREGQTVYFNTIVCWRVEYLDRQQAPPPPQPQAAQPQGQAFNLPPATDPFNSDGDLPF